MIQQIRNIYIVVEGSSEKSFFTKLNSYCAQQEIPISFKIENAEGHTLKKVLNAVRKAGKKIKKDPRGVLLTNVVVFLDFDVFKRKEKLEPYNQKLKHLYFFEYSFEDFLVSLMSQEQRQLWDNICQEQGHYQNPMTADIVETYIKHIFPHYHKGICPLSDITKEHIQQMRRDSFRENIVHVESFLLNYLMPS